MNELSQFVVTEIGTLCLKLTPWERKLMREACNYKYGHLEMNALTPGHDGEPIFFNKLEEEEAE